MRSRKWHRSGGREHLYPIIRATKGGISSSCSSSAGRLHEVPRLRLQVRKSTLSRRLSPMLRVISTSQRYLPSSRSLASTWPGDTRSPKAHETTLRWAPRHADPGSCQMPTRHAVHLFAVNKQLFLQETDTWVCWGKRQGSTETRTPSHLWSIPSFAQLCRKVQLVRSDRTQERLVYERKHRTGMMFTWHTVGGNDNHRKYT